MVVIVVSMVVGTTEPPEVTDDVSLVGMVDVAVGTSDGELGETAAADTLELGPEPETGHTVVLMGMVLVTTAVEWAGQSVTVGAHDVMVTSDVVKMVDVVQTSVEPTLAGCDALAP